MSFELHPRLAADTFPVGCLPLCRVLLMNEARYPWCILVPERAGLREIHELATADRQQLSDEMAAVSAAMAAAFAAEKMNVAALGNQVPQLHIHVIARFASDPAWPAPVWGLLPPEPYDFSFINQTIEKIQAALYPIRGFRTSV